MADGVAAQTEPAADTSEVPQETRQILYEFVDDIMIVRDVARWGRSLIEEAERLDKWTRADVANGETTYDSERRSNDMLSIYHGKHPELAAYEGLCKQAIHTCVAAYKAVNQWCPAKRDTGYQLLRYQPGQQFKVHIDQLSKRRNTRQLSVLMFLNDDYDGGALVFPRQKRVVQPRAGTVVVFPSSFTHPHAGQMVTKGVKYAVVCWFIA